MSYFLFDNDFSLNVLHLEAVGCFRDSGGRWRNLHSADYVTGPERAGEVHTCTDRPKGKTHTEIHTEVLFWMITKRNLLFLNDLFTCLSVCPADSWGGAVFLGEGPKEDSRTPSRYSRILSTLCDMYDVSYGSEKILAAVCVRLCGIAFLWPDFSSFAFSDLVKHVVKEYRNIYPEIMKRAARTFDQVCSVWKDQWLAYLSKKCHIETKNCHNVALFHCFNQVFGLKLVEIDAKNHMYILINKLETVDGGSPIKWVS